MTQLVTPKAEPRQHHILPVFYLAGFTYTGTAQDHVHVFDYLRTKKYKTTPRQVCREKDFFRIHEPGEDPFQIEKEMAQFEGLVAPILDNVRRRGKIKKGGEASDIVNLAALIAARDRRGRYLLSTGLAQSLKEHLLAGKISREKWEKIRGAELRAGIDPSQVPPYEEALVLLQAGEWEPLAPRILQVGMIPEAWNWIAETLREKPWDLIRTDSQKTGGFICSDSPLVWGSLDEIIDGRLNTSLEEKGIEVTFPVSKDLALVSWSGARRSNGIAPRELVGHINMRTLQLGMGLVFYSGADFLLRPRKGQLRKGSEYFAFVEQARRDGMLRP
jgi:hypothetical protein